MYNWRLNRTNDMLAITSLIQGAPYFLPNQMWRETYVYEPIGQGIWDTSQTVNLWVIAQMRFGISCRNQRSTIVHKWCFKAYHAHKRHNVQGVHQILCFFRRIFIIWRPFLRQHWAAIGCTKNYQPIRVTVHSDLLQRWVALLPAGDGLKWTWKNTIFNEHPVP